MATLAELRNERLRKLNQLRQLGLDPYPAHTNRSHTLSELRDSFTTLEGQEVQVVGRITNVRKFGKIAFLVIKDSSGDIQLFLDNTDMEKLDSKQSQLGFKEIALLDSGDFIEAKGKLIKTQTEEISVKVNKLRLLVKTLRPLPTSYEGFTNKEERLRRRYVDMNVNPDIRQRFIRRSRFWQASRDFLNSNGFLEINIPVLEHTTGGADASPFVTHMNALDQDFYLRISHELPLKRLLSAGFEKVYDIGPRFRNENYSDEHLPEHIAMEWYWAFADWQDGMHFQEEMFKQVLSGTFNSLKFNINNMSVDIAVEWQQWDYATVISQHYDGLDIYNCSLSQVKEQLAKHHLEVAKSENKARGIDKLWKNIRKDVVGPIWLVNTPTFISPLAKTNPDNPANTQRFQAVIAGTEISNGFSELNDPIEQYNRFLEQQKMRNEGDEEAMMMDIDFVEMLEFGMPPACGLGFSERVFWLFEGVSAREGVPFPHMRYEVDQTTKEIYKEANL